MLCSMKKVHLIVKRLGSLTQLMTMYKTEKSNCDGKKKSYPRQGHKAQLQLLVSTMLDKTCLAVWLQVQCFVKCSYAFLTILNLSVSCVK